MDIPTHRYNIRVLGLARTERLVREVYAGLPESWSPHLGGGDPTTPHVRTVGARFAAMLNEEEQGFASKFGCMPKLLDKWAAWNLAHKAVLHLRNIGVLEYRKPWYIRHPLPVDPLLKPSRTPCIRASLDLVEHAQSVDDSHIAVPQQAMRGLLSGALVR